MNRISSQCSDADGQSEKRRSSALCGTHSKVISQSLLMLYSPMLRCLPTTARIKNTLQSISISSLHRTLSTNTPYLIPTFSC